MFNEFIVILIAVVIIVNCLLTFKYLDDGLLHMTRFKNEENHKHNQVLTTAHYDSLYIHFIKSIN